MTLGSWMRNYLYIPLGGNRVKNKRRLFFNLWLVFIISGFWHGANWTFLIWGAFHGTFLALERTGYGKFLNKIGKWPSLLITFIVVNFGWFILINSIKNSINECVPIFQFAVHHLVLFYPPTNPPL